METPRADGTRARWRRTVAPCVLLAACLGFVLFADRAAGSLHAAERGVARSYADSLKALDAVRRAASAFSGLQVDHIRARLAAGDDERTRIADETAGRYRALTADLGTIAAHRRAVRVSQAAVAAQDAVSIWHEATRLGSGGQDRPAEHARLAEVAHAQIARLADATERHGLALRGAAEAVVSNRIRRIAGVAAGTALLVALLVGLAALRGRRAPTAPPAPQMGAGAEAAKTDRTPTDGLLAQVVDAARDGIVVVRDRRILYANASACALTGIPASALRPGEPVPSALSADPAGALVPGEHDVCLADGRWLRISRSPLPDGGTLLVFGNVSDRKRRDASAEATASTLQTALDSMSQGLCLYDARHRLVVANRRHGEIFNYEPGSLSAGITATEVLERSMAAGNHPGSTLPELLDQAGRVLAMGDTEDNFQEIAGGRIIQINIGPTAAGGFVATYDDVTERWHAESRIAYMARHDGLTDLPNRVLLAERIKGAITQASRDVGFAVHCLDLDNFKQINDTLGHAVGDELLRAVAYRLTACLREVDTVARLGGDEFAIVQAGIEKAEDAAVLARRIIEVVSAPYELAEHSVTIGVSIGIALAPADGMAADSLLKNADVALYKSKGDGRGVFRFFEAEMDDRLQARRLLEMDLRAAVAAKAFELHYQPIYDLSQDRISGFEALLRWTHPIRGQVAPAEFVPLAEEIGLIVPLGEWVLRQACAEASRWPGNLKIAVNVSPAQFRSAQLISTVREALAETGLAAQRLELEITETVLLANRGATVAILHALRAMGTRIAMDDFGTGYSSLSYLRSFPFDKMKIDQSFIRDLTVENGSGFIVQAVISLGTNLGMTMTAEGVETEDQLARLRAEGCDEAQGYLFSRPVPVSQIAGLLEKWNGAGDVAQAA